MRCDAHNTITCAIEEKNTPIVYTPGNIFRFSDKHGVGGLFYILARIDVSTFNLISLTNGNRWDRGGSDPDEYIKNLQHTDVAPVLIDYDITITPSINDED